MQGKLYIVATPIGNLSDMTYRAVSTLESVDIIAAEDTRHSLKLLNHYKISKKLMSYHQHNKESSGKKIIDRLLSGSDVALVTDAGTPCISDPGYELVRDARELGIEILSIPGACAAISALSVSGLDSSSFLFEGFLPKQTKDIKKRLDILSHENRVIILYESPHRLESTLSMLPSYFRDRKIGIASELTKINESMVLCDVQDIAKVLESMTVRGEYVILIDKYISTDEFSWEDISIEEHIISYMQSGQSKMDAVKLVAKDRKITKSLIYKHSLNIE